MAKHIFLYIIIGAILGACNNNNASTTTTHKSNDTITPAVVSARHFKGALTGGMKGDSIFFDVNAAGTKLENLTFKGYWRCAGKLERQTAAGPQGAFTLKNNRVNDHISEPPNGGSTAWRFDLAAAIGGNSANGTFRMNINALGCNTGTLQWTAVAH